MIHTDNLKWSAVSSHAKRARDSKTKRRNVGYHTNFFIISELFSKANAEKSKIKKVTSLHYTVIMCCYGYVVIMMRTLVLYQYTHSTRIYSFAATIVQNR